MLIAIGNYKQTFTQYSRWKRRYVDLVQPFHCLASKSPGCSGPNVCTLVQQSLFRLKFQIILKFSAHFRKSGQFHSTWFHDHLDNLRFQLQRRI